MAFRMPPPPATAFASTSRKTKRERIRSEPYLAWIRRLPCVVTGHRTPAYTIEAAHVNYADLRYGKLGRGKGDRDDDCWALPLWNVEHETQHTTGDERLYWTQRHIDPLRVALALWRCWSMDDLETALIVIENARDT